MHLLDHHRCHAASSYYLSPWQESAVLTFDGIGSDGTSTLLGHGRGDRIDVLRRIRFPHSLGAMYAGVTGYLGFTPTRDEGKVMGLAPFGAPTYVDAFRELVHLDPDGGYELDLSLVPAPHDRQAPDVAEVPATPSGRPGREPR